MKTKLVCIALFSICISSFSQTDQIVAKANYNYLNQCFENTKIITIAFIKAMPADSYLYKPTDSVRTYSALAAHIVYSIEWNIELIKGTPVKWTPGDENRFTKQELINYANEQFDRLIKFISNAEVSPKLTEKIIDVLNHNELHRGQMITYLRLKGITPPKA